MNGKKLLTAFLLGVGLCFVPALGHGEINKWVQEQIFERKVRNINFELLRARVNYMMRNPTTFLEVNFTYPNLLVTFPGLPENVHVFARIVVTIRDTRDRFSYKSGVALLDQFKKDLKVTCSFIDDIATDMNTDVVGTLYTKHTIPLAYFYQGEYHLWEK